MLRLIFLTLFTLSFVAITTFNNVAFAQSPEDTVLLIQRGTEISSLMTQKNGSNCKTAPPFCSPFLNKLIEDDKADGYFVDFNLFGNEKWTLQFGKMLDGRFPGCTKYLNAKENKFLERFQTPQQLQSFAEQTEWPNLGTYNHQSIKGCLGSGNSPSDFNKAAKYYYAMSRLNQGVKDGLNELAQINAILGNSSVKNLCPTAFKDATELCESLSLCPQNPNALKQVVQKSVEDEASYKKILADIEAKNSGCLKSSDKSKQEVCEIEQRKNFQSLALLERTNPWFTDESYWKNREKKQDPEKLIKASLEKTKSALQELVRDLNKQALCLNGGNTSNCSIEKFRESLGSTKEYKENYTKNIDHLAMLTYMSAQQCVEEGAMDRTKTSEKLRMLGRDALLTIGTAGAGGAALKVAQWAGRGISTAKKVGTGVAVGADLFYGGESVLHSIDSCLIEYDKQMVDLSKSKAGDNGNICPNPMNQKVASVRAGESCGSTLVDVGLNALPLVPALVGKVREKLKTVEKSGWVDHTKRSSEPTVRKTANSQRPENRTKFISDYFERNYTSTAQNQKWIDLAANSKTGGKTKFFEVENSVMKELNDVTQDKNFVSAITNKHKELMTKNLKSFSEKFPGVEILPYSDFKAMRFALRPKPPATSLPAGVETELANVLKKSNSEFTQFMKDNKLLRDGDTPENWFRAGVGDTADQATLASRYSRGVSGENKLRSFKDADLQENMTATLGYVEIYRNDLQNQLRGSGLMDYVSSSSKMTLKPEVFDAVRKTQSNAELRDSIKRSTGYAMSELEADKIRTYALLVDGFSPGIHIAERKVASLDDAKFGGFSLDFAGMGSKNARATADSLALRSSDLSSAVNQSRSGEKEVTILFKEKKAQVESTISSILKKHGIEAKIIDSGDDMVIKPNKAISADVRREVTEALAKNVDPSSVRVSHVPAGVASHSDRPLIGTHGETIEKYTRKFLQGDLPKEKLNQVLLMVDMHSTRAGTGSAELILGTNGLQLNDLEKQKIKNAFKSAIEKLNQSLIEEKRAGLYRSAG